MNFPHGHKAHVTTPFSQSSSPLPPCYLDVQETGCSVVQETGHVVVSLLLPSLPPVPYHVWLPVAGCSVADCLVAGCLVTGCLIMGCLVANFLVVGTS